MLDKLLYQCTSVDDVCEQLRKGSYVFTYVELKGGRGIKFINAYHLCEYGLEAFSFDRDSNDFPLKLRRADVHYSDHINTLDEKIRKHISMRYKQFAGFIVCNSLLDLENIPKPTRFKAFP